MSLQKELEFLEKSSYEDLLKNWYTLSKEDMQVLMAYQIKQFESQKNKISNLERELAEEYNKCQYYQGLLEFSNQQNRQFQEELIRQEQLNTKQNEYQSNRNLEAHFEDDKENELGVRTQQLGMMRQAIFQLKKESQSNRKKYEELKAVLSQYQETSVALKSQLKAEKLSHQKTKEQIYHTDKSYKDLRDLYIKKDNEILEIEKRLAEEKKIRAKFEEQLNLQNYEKEEMKNLNLNNEELHLVAIKSKEISGKYDELDLVYKKIQKEKSDKEEEVRTYKIIVDEKEKSLQCGLRTIDQLHKKVDGLQTENKQFTKQIHANKQKSLDVDKKKLDVEKQGKNYCGRISELQGSLEVHKKEIEKLKKESKEAIEGKLEKEKALEELSKEIQTKKDNPITSPLLIRSLIAQFISILGILLLDYGILSFFK